MMTHTRNAAIWTTAALPLFVAVTGAGEPTTDPPNPFVDDGDEARITVNDLQPLAEDQPVEPDSSSALDELEMLLGQPVLVPALEQEVTSVTRQASTVGKSAAAVFVLTCEMIRRSGANNIPDALRLVPGVQVARVDSNKWAISARGFGNRFANKLLVLIDGRSIYTPLSSGVYWEAQDVVLQDVERIEVIRGPGATAWGANAVNGVINIITKTSRDTQGTLIAAGGGDQDKSINAVRVGGRIGDNLHYRVYGKHSERARSFNYSPTHDDSRMGRYGFRADWYPGGCDCDTITVQGEYFAGILGNSIVNVIPVAPFTEFVVDDIDHSGGFFLARWNHQIDEDSATSLQAYFDRTNRDDLQVDQVTDVLDLDFQHNFVAAERHAITWGVRFRHVSDDIGTNTAFTFRMVPVKRNTDLISGWIQDEISLGDEAVFTIGTKLEHNDYTGGEVQPTARLMWSLDERRVLWGAVSRAVRTPSRIEDDIRFRAPAGPGTFLFLQGNAFVESENLMAYEIGYRAQPADCFSWDMALFYNEYEDLISFRPSGPRDPPVGVPADIPFLHDNIAHAETYGVELSCQCTLTECWRLDASYSFLEIQSHGSFNDAWQEERSPQNQAFLMSSWDLPRRVELDLMARYVDVLPNVNAPPYISLDARLGWRPNDCWEFSVVGQNLLDSHHVEFSPSSLVQTTPTEVRRGVYAQIVWRP